MRPGRPGRCATRQRGRPGGTVSPLPKAANCAPVTLSPPCLGQSTSSVSARAVPRRASRAASTADKNAALLAAADLLLDRAAEILAANAADVADAEAAGMDAGPLDRLRLTDARLEGMADGLREVAALPDPIGEVLDGWRRPNGLQIERVRVPLGVVAIIYENRPNVTSDAAGICLKSGNAALLRGSATALRSNIAIVDVLRDAAREGRAARPTASSSSRTSGTRPPSRSCSSPTRRLPDPARRPGAHPEHPRQRDRARDHRRRRQLPRVRRRGRRPRRGARHRREREDEPAERVQRGGVAASCTRRSPTRSCRAWPTRSREHGVELVGDDGARKRLAVDGCRHRRRLRPRVPRPRDGGGGRADARRRDRPRQPVRHRPHRGDPDARPRRGAAVHRRGRRGGRWS